MANIFNGLINLILSVLGFIAGLIIKPITALILAIFPNMQPHVDTTISFLNEYLFKGLAFAREVFFNTTGASREIFAILVTILFVRIALKPTLQAYKFIKNMWSLFRRGETE